MKDLLISFLATTKKTILKVEPWIAKFLDFIPNLKKNQQKQLARYLCVVSLVLAILGAILVLFAILNLLNLIKVTFIVKPTLASYLVKNNLWRLVTGLINVLMTAALEVIFAKSIQPLQEFKKEGWWYLFVICLANILKVIISALLSFNLVYFVPTIVLGTLFSVVGLYILQQTKPYFKN